MSETETPTEQPGSIGWSECMTPDPAAAVAFYTQLFGWTTDTMPMGEEGVYTMLVNEGVPIAGVMGITPEMGEVPPHWINYIVVEDAAATEARIVELGGQVIVPAMQIADKGIMVKLADPTGAVIAVWQSLC